MAGGIDAVDEVARRLAASVALSDHGRLFVEFDPHPRIEGIERSFPQSFASEFLTIADDATLDLIDLGESPILHQGRKDFASDSTSAVGDDGLLLEVIVFATLELCDEVTSR